MRAIVTTVEKIQASIIEEQRKQIEAQQGTPAPTDQQIEAGAMCYEWPEQWSDAKVREVCREVWCAMHEAGKDKTC